MLSPTMLSHPCHPLQQCHTSSCCIFNQQRNYHRESSRGVQFFSNRRHPCSLTLQPDTSRCPRIILRIRAISYPLSSLNTEQSPATKSLGSDELDIVDDDEQKASEVWNCSDDLSVAGANWKAPDEIVGFAGLDNDPNRGDVEGLLCASISSEADTSNHEAPVSRESDVFRTGDQSISSLPETEDGNTSSTLNITDAERDMVMSDLSIDSLTVNGTHSGILTEASGIAVSDGLANEAAKGDDDDDPVKRPAYDQFETSDDNIPQVTDEVELYDPQVGDIVLGVVVSVNGDNFHLDIGSNKVGLMLGKDMRPFRQRNLDDMLYRVPNDEQQDEIVVPAGKSCFIADEKVNSIACSITPAVDRGTVVMAEVLGITPLTGTPLLSARSIAQKIALHRVKQLREVYEPVEVEITKWNNGGLLCDVEGLRAFLPKVQLLHYVESVSSLKEYVGKRISVMIIDVEEEKNTMIVSEIKAWDWKYIRQGILHDGTIIKVFPYGLRVQIDNTRTRGFVHISHVSRSRVEQLENMFSVAEKVKVLVIGKENPFKVFLSIAGLESESGLIIRDKERVFREAEDMARLYRESLSEREQGSDCQVKSDVDFWDPIIANWTWMEFNDEALP